MLKEIARKYEQDEYWTTHLEWLLENKPELVRRLFETDKAELRMFISRKVEQAHKLGSRLEKRGLEPDQIAEIVLADVIAPPPPEDPPDALPDRLRARILRWAENLTDQRLT